MSIKSIRVTNFKSFKDLEVNLGKFNVLIGINASGKSNFVQIFKFIKDIDTMVWTMRYPCREVLSILET